MMVQTSEKSIDFSVARPGTNVVLVAEGQEIHVNKEFLSAFSPYFNTLLQSRHFMESSSRRVKIDHNYDQLLKCIEIVHGVALPSVVTYHRYISLSTCPYLEELANLLKSADRFDLSAVRRYCESELTALRLRSSRFAVDIFLLASEYQLRNKDLLLNEITTEDWKEWRARLTGYRAPTEYPIANSKDRQLKLSMHDFMQIFMRLNIS